MTRPSPHRNLLVGLFFLSAFLVIGIMAYDRYRKAHEPPPPPPPVSSPIRIVSLFFPDAEWTRLVREGREIEGCDDTAACVRELLVELQNGPIGDLSPVFPDGSTQPLVQVAGDIVTLDLPSDFVAGLEGGSADELLTVYSVVNSVAASFPELKRVRFLVEGKVVETLHGHLDVREPLEPDFSLERQDLPHRSAPSPKESK